LSYARINEGMPWSRTTLPFPGAHCLAGVKIFRILRKAETCRAHRRHRKDGNTCWRCGSCRSRTRFSFVEASPTELQSSNVVKESAFTSDFLGQFSILPLGAKSVPARTRICRTLQLSCLVRIYRKRGLILRVPSFIRSQRSTQARRRRLNVLQR
jgi:hypothetical protein